MLETEVPLELSLNQKRVMICLRDFHHAFPTTEGHGPCLDSFYGLSSEVGRGRLVTTLHELIALEMVKSARKRYINVDFDRMEYWLTPKGKEIAEQLGEL